MMELQNLETNIHKQEQIPQISIQQPENFKKGMIMKGGNYRLASIYEDPEKKAYNHTNTNTYHEGEGW